VTLFPTPLLDLPTCAAMAVIRLPTIVTMTMVMAVIRLPVIGYREVVAHLCWTGAPSRSNEGRLQLRVVAPPLLDLRDCPLTLILGNPYSNPRILIQ